MTRLRLVAAVVVAAAGAALVFGGMGAIGWLLVAVGWLAALGWVAMARRSSRRIREAGDYWLELGDMGLVLALGAEPEVVRWDEVVAVDACEDTLTVRVQRLQRPPLAVPLLWRGVGLHDLADAIERARERGVHGEPPSSSLV